MNKINLMPEYVLLQSFLRGSSLPACICRHDEGLVDANDAFLNLFDLETLSLPCPVDALLKTAEDGVLDNLESRLRNGPIQIPAFLARGKRENHGVAACIAPLENRESLFTISIESRANGVSWQKHIDNLVKACPDAVYVFDDARNIVYANQAAADFTGYPVKELCLMNVGDLDSVYPCANAEDFEKFAQAGTRRVFQTEHLARDGSRKQVEVSLSVDRVDGKLFVYSFVRDLSDRIRSSRFTEELKFVLEHASDSIYLYDQKGTIYYVNQMACNQLGFSREELYGMNIREIDDSFSETDNLALKVNNNSFDSGSVVTRHKRRDGSTFPVQVVATSCLLDSHITAVAFARDISDQVAAQQALVEGEERFRVIADTSPVALVICHGKSHAVQYVNTQGANLFGKNPDVLSGMNVNALFYEPLINASSDEDAWEDMLILNREVRVRTSKRSNVWVSVNASTFMLQGENVICLALLDVTEARELSSQLRYQASYDDLTGLYNRREFNTRLQECLDHSVVTGKPSALCYLDLDQFKVVNDSCGHTAGDELLRQIARVLECSIRSNDVLARLGGDEFAVLLENCSLGNAEAVANKIRANMQAFRFVWEDKTFNITASIGLVPAGTDGESLTDLMRRGDTACYLAKDGGRNRVHILQSGDEDHQQRQGEMQWITRLNEALDDNGFMLYAQAITDTGSPYSEPSHLEILVRMRGRDGEIVMPGNFLPVAERYGMATRVDRWVINAVFDWLKAHPDSLGKISCCAINLSGQSLGNEEFLHELVAAIETSGIPAHKLCFEITETAAIANLSRASQFMRSLKNLGCAFALDDFGSGLSSFGYLKRLPVDYVKIDGQFVRDVLNDPVDLAMVKSINDMAHAMGKLTVAEYVSSPEILEAMIEIGVDFVQGYDIAMPLPLE